MQDTTKEERGHLFKGLFLSISFKKFFSLFPLKILPSAFERIVWCFDPPSADFSRNGPMATLADSLLHKKLWLTVREIVSNENPIESVFLISFTVCEFGHSQFDDLTTFTHYSTTTAYHVIQNPHSEESTLGIFVEHDCLLVAHVIFFIWKYKLIIRSSTTFLAWKPDKTFEVYPNLK